MRELQTQKVLSLDTIHYLFGNLNALVDFQRRFLIQMEDMAEKPAQEQRLGLLFVQNEEAFSVYEPYCANYYSAQDLVVQEAPKLQKLANILNPTYELPSMLIKPVQRICKYPLLMSELIKSTDKAWPHLAEMEQGLEAIKRVAEKVNETQRKHENVQAVEDLKKRIDDGVCFTFIVFYHVLILIYCIVKLYRILWITHVARQAFPYDQGFCTRDVSFSFRAMLIDLQGEQRSCQESPYQIQYHYQEETTWQSSRTTQCGCTSNPWCP